MVESLADSNWERDGEDTSFAEEQRNWKKKNE